MYLPSIGYSLLVASTYTHLRACLAGGARIANTTTNTAAEIKDKKTDKKTDLATTADPATAPSSSSSSSSSSMAVLADVLLLMVTVAILCAFAVHSSQRSLDWKDNESLWKVLLLVDTLHHYIDI
jgi:hypothetical protein